MCISPDFLIKNYEETFHVSFIKNVVKYKVNFLLHVSFVMYESICVLVYLINNQSFYKLMPTI